jgi:hypothetical protein
MSRPRITDAQLDCWPSGSAPRRRAVETFLKVAGGLAALGAAGFNARPVSAAAEAGPPGEKLAKDQHCGSAAAAGGRTTRPATTTTRTCTAAACPRCGPAS